VRLCRHDRPDAGRTICQSQGGPQAGLKAAAVVKRYGIRLLPELFMHLNPMPYDGARDMEVELAIGLREAGYGVWQA